MPNSDVIHLFFLSRLFEELLEGNSVGHFLHRPLQTLPRMAKLCWAVRIAQGRGIEDCAMHSPKHITEGYFGWGPSEHVTALLATQAASDALRLEFNQNLDQIIRGH